MKQSLRRVLATVLTVIMVMTAIPLAGIADADLGSLFASKASALTYGDYEYTVSDSKATITKYHYDYSETVISVPSSLGGYPVTKIGDYAFRSCIDVTDVIIPGSVASIGEWAFNGCIELENVTISNGVKSIGSYAFSYCSGLKNITIPGSVTDIGEDIFYYCTGLESISVDKSSNYFCSDEYGVLYNKNKSELIAYPKANHRTSFSIPDGVESIAAGAFAISSSLTKITIPDSIKEIGDMAFNCCTSLTDAVIPNKVTCIPYAAFSNCENLSSVKIPDSVKKIKLYAFSGCKNLSSVTIPSGVTVISEATFEHCEKLTDIIIPDSVTSIENSAFSYCYGLTEITVPKNVESIGDFAFRNCSALTEITIPESVKSIGYSASDGTAIKKVFYGGTKTQWGKIEWTKLPDEIDTGNGNEALINAEIVFGKFDVIFNANGGSISPSETVAERGKPIVLPVPVRSGYTCAGWSESKTAENAAYSCGANYTTSSDVTLYAVWKQNDTVKPTGSISSTNNVASSQTVTLSLSDNVGVAGYYWGTSSTYSNNTYTATSSSSVTKSVSSSGTYYLTVKDTSGNISSTSSIIFYKTTLNANGGSVSPTSVLTKLGNSFTFPTPVKSGYTFVGWSEDKSAASGIKGLAPTSNATYYAIWSQNDTVKPTGSISSTNNVEASQTVTLSLSDNVKVAGYYWGTSSTYSNNTYTATSSSSVAKSVSSSGTYYLTVKDTSGNVSSNYSITFYKTTLNANGGSVSPTSVLTKSGNSFTFPTPVKSGYTYSGWSTSSSATSGVTTLKPTSNSTYYAVWKIVSQGFNQSNRFSFSNSSSHFVTSWSGGSYYMTQSDYNKLTSYIKKYDGSSAATISDVQDLMYSKWGGSCYGMASAAVLDYQNKIAFNENFGNGAATMWDVKSPSTDKNIMSAVNYYMVSQKIGFVRNSSSYYDKNYYPSSWTPGLKKLVSTAQKGEPFLFCYYWVDAKGSSCGHAIVALDCKTNSDGSFSITAYDNRYPNKDIIIKVNSGCTSCVVNGNENAVAFEIYNDMSAFDKIDIDGPDNDMNVSFNSYSYSSANDEISVVANSDVTVTNADGETISIINGDISGTMDILSVHMTVRDTADGEAAPVEFVFEVGHSKTYMFESTDDEMEVSVKTKDAYGSASSENADCIAIGDDGVYVIGNDMEYSTALSSKDTGYDTVILSGTAKQDVSLTYSGDSILISGVNGKDETISIFAQDEISPEDYEIKEGYEQVKVTAENNSIDIMGSSNNDGRFDISVVKKDDIKSVSVSDIEVKYKAAAKIVPQIDIADGAEYTVKYESSNPSVATVDKDGNVTTFSKGEAEITCTVTDEYGNTATDAFRITVKFRWWQWLIWILLFGFLWY